MDAAPNKSLDIILSVTYRVTRASMVWYGMVWYGMVWYGMVWYCMIWYGMKPGSDHWGYAPTLALIG